MTDQCPLSAEKQSILGARPDYRVCPLRDLPDWLASRSTWVKLDIWITSKPLDETHKCLSRFSDLKATPSRAGSSVAVRS
jgi:hypothetical protein